MFLGHCCWAIEHGGALLPKKETSQEGKYRKKKNEKEIVKNKQKPQMPRPNSDWQEDEQAGKVG